MAKSYEQIGKKNCPTNNQVFRILHNSKFLKIFCKFKKK